MWLQHFPRDVDLTWVFICRLVIKETGLDGTIEYSETWDYMRGLEDILPSEISQAQRDKEKPTFPVYLSIYGFFLVHLR